MQGFEPTTFDIQGERSNRQAKETSAYNKKNEVHFGK